MATISRSPQMTPELIRSRQRHLIYTIAWKTAAVLVLAAVSSFILFPALWMLSTALKPDDQVALANWIPRPPVWRNFIEAWTSVPFTRYTINTALYSAACVIGETLSSSLVAYGFARLRFPGRNLLFGIMLSTMMIPGMVTMIPQYVLFSKLHWVGSYLPLVVPKFFGTPFFIFLLRQMFMGIPEELCEAARIDGANEFWIYSRVILPLSKASLATVALMSFEGAWNAYVGPVLYISNTKLYTVQVGLAMFKSSSQTEWQHLMAASIIVMLPIIILFSAFQRYFTEGAAISGGVKG